jgi:hypothetical protein
MQDLWDTIKRLHLWIIGIEGKKVQAKGIQNIQENTSRKFPKSWEKANYLGRGGFNNTTQIKTRKEPLQDTV